MEEDATSLALAELVRAVERLRTDHDYDHAILEELQAAVAQLTHQRRQRPEGAFPSWQDWVDGWLAVRISRHPHRYRWCHQYAEHPEVADRLEALWHSWESLWPDPTARVTWFRDALDPQLTVITALDGPLRECSAYERHHVGAAALAVLGD